MSPGAARPRAATLDRGDRVVHVRCSTRADGDFHLDGHSVVLEHRRQSFMPGRWTQLDEVHGSRVVEVLRPGDHDRAEGDAAVTACAGAVLAVWVGDCAPVVLVGDDGAVGVVHAGWRGALDGVLQAAVKAMPSQRIEALLGPCIHPCCYEFGSDDLRTLTNRYGAAVASTTSWGSASLSMPAVVAAALSKRPLRGLRRTLQDALGPRAVERAIDAGTSVVVGVNKFGDRTPIPAPPFSIVGR